MEIIRKPLGQLLNCVVDAVSCPHAPLPPNEGTPELLFRTNMLTAQKGTQSEHARAACNKKHIATKQNVFALCSCIEYLHCVFALCDSSSWF